MFDLNIAFALIVFALTVVFIMWRPYGVNEAIPTAIGATLMFLAGIVPLSDVFLIFEMVSGAAVTILSTIVMSIILESIGFFRWAAVNLACKARGSGILLFWYINLLCFLMTLFFNNDGSILITTPIIIQTLTLLNLKNRQKIPYLLSGALIATGSSAPIGVSNLANLIALKIVGLDLNSYAAMMFVPSMIGIVAIATLLILYFKQDIPRKIPRLSLQNMNVLTHSTSHTSARLLHPLSVEPTRQAPDWQMFRICIIIVVLTRISFFMLAPFGIPTEIPAMAGALLLIFVRWCLRKEGAFDIIKKTPWHILIFAFSMYVVIYGLHNVGFTSMIVALLRDVVSASHFDAIFVMGILLSIMSNLCNNLPSIMIGTLSLTEMNLDVSVLQVSYLASILGADIGSLLLPIGTLASLIWIFILRENHVPISWGQYLKATLFVIPAGLFISLLALYAWTDWLFF